MEIHDTRKDKKPYMGIREIISSVTLGGKVSDATPNLPEAVVKSIFQGLPYPQTLYSACIRRIRAEQKLTITRAAIIKAYLNRQSNNNKKIDIMLDKDNNNQGYLCGRLFAVLDKIQEDANKISSIRERYMEIQDTRKDKKPYMGLNAIISSVSLQGKIANATPNLPEAVVKSIFQGLPYPISLFQACIRRIRAEVALEKNGKKINPVNILRAAIIKAYLNRQSNNNKKIDIMLDKDNNNQGYLCGRLFAVLENLQFAANGQDSIRSSYMNAASTTPSTVFSTILKLSNNHYGKLAKDKKGLAIFFDNQKKEIMAMLQEFPDTLELNDQGRFFLGYYHQKNYKENNNSEE